MHIYFSGIGGVAIGPLARIARDLGHDVTGSDKEQSRYSDSVVADGISVEIGQTTENIAKVHQEKPIDWFVYTSGLPADHPELKFAQENGIKATKRDVFINDFLVEKNLKLLAVAGTHGKTNTTGMLVWMFQQLNIPVSYSVGTNITFGPNGKYDANSQYFVYEADEFDRNFLKFKPFASVFTAVDYDHPETYPTVEDYKKAFVEFADQSESLTTWQSIADYLSLEHTQTRHIISDSEQSTTEITLIGRHTRSNAFLAVSMMESILPDTSRDQLLEVVNTFPGTERRMEKLAPGLYSDYAHHPVEIKAAIEAATEFGQPVVAVYQPHQNNRQHEVQDAYSDVFEKAAKVYWLPTYLSRERLELPVLTPEDLIAKLNNPRLAEPANMDEGLKVNIAEHRKNGRTVLLLCAGDLDAWARQDLFS